MNQENMPCIICGNPAVLMCQRCGEPYCNDVCQRKDWQRHKYVCTIMPSLVTLKTQKPMAMVRRESVSSHSVATRPIEKAVDNQNQNPNCGLEAMVQDLSVGESSKSTLNMEWRQSVMPPEKQFFECRVTCMQRDGPIWVVDVANTERLERMTNNIERSMQDQQPCRFQDLSVGALVGIAVDNKMYRGEVLALQAVCEGAEVRLIDYGAVVACDVKDIYLPVHRMTEHKAYAFRVKLPTNTGVQINKNLTLRLLGTKTPDGIEQVQLKPKMTIPLNLPVQMLAINPEVSVARILQHDVALKEPQVALLQIKVMTNLNDDLNARLGDKPVQPFTGPFPEEIRTFFLAARTKDGFQRALLIDFIKQPQIYLVYQMDEGCISITNEVRRIPSELLGHHMRVFAVTLTDGNIQQQLPQDGRDLCIKFQTGRLQEDDKDKLRAAQAMLLANGEQVCAVRVNTFLGRVADLGHKYWREPIETGHMVYITHVFNYHEISISSVQTKQYDAIFKHLESKCPPVTNCSDVSIGIVVLVSPPGQLSYRAEVTGVNGKIFTVYNIDNGSTHHVPDNWMRMGCPFVENLPVSQCRVEINTICNLPSSAVPSNTAALILLMKLLEQKSDMEVKFTDSASRTVDLLDSSVDPNSLVTRLLPMMFTPSAVELEPAQSSCAHVVEPESIKEAPQVKPVPTNVLPPLPPSPPSSPTKAVQRFYLNDLERHLIPLGDKMQILVLNAIDLHKTGYVTACFFSSEKVAENFQNLLNMVAEVGCNDDQLARGYLPDVDEMCLTLFSEDSSWYRGVCQRVTGQKASILYCDFGNSEVVPVERIKPIPSKLLEAVYATKCFIDGFDKTKQFFNLEQYLTVKNKINCTVLDGPEPNTRLINIPILDKILSREII